LDPLSIGGKPQYVKHFEDIFAIVDAAGLCVFLAIAMV
jgi:aldehyde:ferredoxin oxidoreductase